MALFSKRSLAVAIGSAALGVLGNVLLEKHKGSFLKINLDDDNDDDELSAGTEAEAPKVDPAETTA